jgi:hypothetical protein
MIEPFCIEFPWYRLAWMIRSTSGGGVVTSLGGLAVGKSDSLQSIKVLPVNADHD